MNRAYDLAMHYLPVWCDDCKQAMLAPASEYTQRQIACHACSAQMRVIPGSNFTEGDGPLFKQLDEVVAAADFLPADAQRLGIELQERVAVGGHDEALWNLVPHLPGLEAIARLLRAHPARMHTAALMLDALITARMRRGRSGIMSATPLPTTGHGRKSG